MSTDKVFIVDDEQDNIDFLEEILSETSFETVGFTDGNEALAEMKKDAPRLAILDVQMPAINGFQLLQAMREAEDLTEVPVIFLSAIGAVTGVDYDEDSIEKKYGVRPQAFIPKPIAHDKVLETIEQVLG